MRRLLGAAQRVSSLGLLPDALSASERYVNIAPVEHLGILRVSRKEVKP